MVGGGAIRRLEGVVIGGSGGGDSRKVIRLEGIFNDGGGGDCRGAARLDDGVVNGDGG